MIFDLKHPIDLGKGKTLTKIKIEDLKAKHYKYIPKEVIGLAYDYKKIDELREILEKEQQNGNNEEICNELIKKIETKERNTFMELFPMISKTYPLIAILSGHSKKIIGELHNNDINTIVFGVFDALGGV